MVTIIGKPIVIRTRKARVLPFEETDGGRREAGILDSLDCTVRALAIAANVRYAEAHETLELFGRKPHDGIKWRLFIEPYTRDERTLHGCRVRSVQAEFGMPKTVGQFILQNPRGRFIVRIRQHVFAVINGTIRDTRPIGSKFRVKAIYQFDKQTS